MKTNAEFAADEMLARAVREDRTKPSLDTAAIYEAAALLYKFVGCERRSAMCAKASQNIREESGLG